MSADPAAVLADPVLADPVAAPPDAGALGAAADALALADPGEALPDVQADRPSATSRAASVVVRVVIREASIYSI
jgi:hypothetical protein